LFNDVVTLLNLRDRNGNYWGSLLFVLFDENFCRVLLEKPVFIPVGILTEDLILDRCLACLLINAVNSGLPSLNLIIESLKFTSETVLFVSQIRNLLLYLLALEAIDSFQLFLEFVNLELQGVFCWYWRKYLLALHGWDWDWGWLV
jgi:hypothetical protein